MTSMLVSDYNSCAVLEHQNINGHCLKNYFYFEGEGEVKGITESLSVKIRVLKHDKNHFFYITKQTTTKIPGMRLSVNK